MSNSRMLFLMAFCVRFTHLIFVVLTFFCCVTYNKLTHTHTHTLAHALPVWHTQTKSSYILVHVLSIHTHTHTNTHTHTCIYIALGWPHGGYVVAFQLNLKRRPRQTLTAPRELLWINLSKKKIKYSVRQVERMNLFSKRFATAFIKTNY